MRYEKAVKASELLYATHSATVRDISRKVGLKEEYVERIKRGFGLYLEENLTPEEIAARVRLPVDAMKAIIRGFFRKCTDAYRHYQDQVIGSISGSAETVGINRFYFEDWFWSNAVDSNDKDGKECLEKLTKELSCL
jgi:hypothetical protein